MEKLLIQNLIRRGQRLTAQRLLRSAVLELRNQQTRLALPLYLEKVLGRLQPKVGLRNKKVAGSLYRIPAPYSEVGRRGLAAKWLVNSGRKGQGPSHLRLARELMDCASQRGVSTRRRKEVHRLAVANRSNLKYM